MPKAKYLLNGEEKRAAALEEQKRRLRVEIAGAVGRIKCAHNMASYEIAEAAGFPQSTFSAKSRRPETFTFGDILRLSQRFPEFRRSVIAVLTQQR